MRVSARSISTFGYTMTSSRWRSRKFPENRTRPKIWQPGTCKTDPAVHVRKIHVIELSVLRHSRDGDPSIQASYSLVPNRCDCQSAVLKTITL